MTKEVEVGDEFAGKVLTKGAELNVRVAEETCHLAGNLT
jgi:hypothetical protein